MQTDVLWRGWLAALVFRRLLEAGRIWAGEEAVLSQAKERPVVVLEYRDERAMLSTVYAEWRADQ
jgi:hypothetical protein